MIDFEKKAKRLISEKTGVDVEEITDDSFFEDDLNVGELELIEILEELEELFDIELTDKKNDIETFGDLTELIADRIE